jgi:hypothetical protein
MKGPTVMNITRIRVLAAAAALSLPIAIAGAATASPERHYAPSSASTAAASSRPTIYQVQLWQVNIPLGPQFNPTTVLQSGVLPKGNYHVEVVLTAVMGPADNVVCADGTTTNFDTVTGNYGYAGNGSSTGGIYGNAVINSTVTITQPNDKIQLVCNSGGSAGTYASGASLTAEPIGKIVLSH